MNQRLSFGHLLGNGKKDAARVQAMNTKDLTPQWSGAPVAQENFVLFFGKRPGNKNRADYIKAKKNCNKKI